MGILERLAADSAYQDLKRAHAGAMASYRSGLVCSRGGARRLQRLF